MSKVSALIACSSRETRLRDSPGPSEERFPSRQGETWQADGDGSPEYSCDRRPSHWRRRTSSDQLTSQRSVVSPARLCVSRSGKTYESGEFARIVGRALCSPAPDVARDLQGQ